MDMEEYEALKKRVAVARATAWRISNLDRAKATAKAYYLANRDALREKAIAHRIANREAYRTRDSKTQKAWREKYPWYSNWQSARSRCVRPKDVSYRFYGAKGVKFLLSKADMAFMWARDKATSQVQPSLDRIDSAGNYELSNCRFIPKQYNCARAPFEKKATMRRAFNLAFKLHLQPPKNKAEAEKMIMLHTKGVRVCVV